MRGRTSDGHSLWQRDEIVCVMEDRRESSAVSGADQRCSVVTGARTEEAAC